MLINDFVATFTHLRIVTPEAEARLRDMLLDAAQRNDSSTLEVVFALLDKMCNGNAEVRLYSDKLPLALYWTWNRLPSTQTVMTGLVARDDSGKWSIDSVQH